MAQADTPETDYGPERALARRERFVVLSGCSGGGKSTLAAALAARGHRVFPEPGRQIVREQLFLGGDGLPWVNVPRFADLTASRALHFMLDAARSDGLAFFDRSFIDQIAALEELGIAVPPDLESAAARLHYAETVFVVPPWREIFENDPERRHGFDEAAASYRHLAATYRRLGYRVVEVPKLSPAERADFVLATISGAAG